VDGDVDGCYEMVSLRRKKETIAIERIVGWMFPAEKPC
jgi:hypothetical protein